MIRTWKKQEKCISETKDIYIVSFIIVVYDHREDTLRINRIIYNLSGNLFLKIYFCLRLSNVFSRGCNRW